MLGGVAEAAPRGEPPVEVGQEGVHLLAGAAVATPLHARPPVGGAEGVAQVEHVHFGAQRRHLLQVAVQYREKVAPGVDPRRPAAVTTARVQVRVAQA